VKEKSSAETTFGSIESAAEYLALLLEVVEEARADLETETNSASAAGADRRQQAIQLATYKLSQLKVHVTTSHRLLNDLRTIRRLLFDERRPAAATPEVEQPRDAVHVEAAKRVARRPRASRAEQL
jgi:hypothetical protein